MCMECNYKIYQEYKPTEKESEQFIDEFPEFYKKHNNAVNWDFWMRYYPKKLKILINYFEKYIRKFNGKEDLPEVYYVVVNKLITTPKCPICGKSITLFHNSTHCYATHCHEHLYTCSNSVGETELKSYIESLGFKTVADTKSWSWLYKGVRYNRLNKIKDAQKGNLLQCYNSGVSKYVYE